MKKKHLQSEHSMKIKWDFLQWSGEGTLPLARFPKKNVHCRAKSRDKLHLSHTIQYSITIFNLSGVLSTFNPTKRFCHLFCLRILLSDFYFHSLPFDIWLQFLWTRIKSCQDNVISYDIFDHSIFRSYWISSISSVHVKWYPSFHSTFLLCR